MHVMSYYNKKHIDKEEVFALVDKALETSGSGFPFYVHDIKGNGLAAIELLETYQLISYINGQNNKSLCTYIVNEKGIEVRESGGIKVFLELEASIKRIHAVTPRSPFKVIHTPGESLADDYRQARKAYVVAAIAITIALISSAAAAFLLIRNN